MFSFVDSDANLIPLLESPCLKNLVSPRLLPHITPARHRTVERSSIRSHLASRYSRKMARSSFVATMNWHDRTHRSRNSWHRHHRKPLRARALSAARRSRWSSLAMAPCRTARGWRTRVVTTDSRTNSWKRIRLAATGLDPEAHASRLSRVPKAQPSLGLSADGTCFYFQHLTQISRRNQ